MLAGEQKSQPPFIFLIFCLAFIVRLFFFLYFSSPEISIWKYQELALRFRGELYPPTIPFYSSPGYIFVVAISQLAGLVPFGLKFIQIVVDSLSCCLVFLLGRYFFQKLTALVATLTAIVYTPMLIYSSSLLPATWVVFFNLLSIWLLTRYQDNNDKFILPAAGAILGVSIVFRPNLGIFVVFLFFWLAYRQRARCFFPLFLFISGLIIPLIPVAAWNAQGEEFIPVTASGGWVFYCANNEQANGFSYSPPPRLDSMMTRYFASGQAELGYVEHLFSRKLACVRKQRNLSHSQASTYWFKEGISFYRRQPVKAAKLALKKAHCAINRYEPHDLPELISRAEKSSFLGLGPALIFPLALLGLFVSRARDKKILYLYLLSYLISFVFIYVTPRYRLPVAPVLILFAAAGIMKIFEVIKTKRFWRLAGLIALLAVTSTVVWYLPQSLRVDRDINRPAFLEEWRGLNELRNDEPDKAISHFQAALKIKPESLRARQGLATAKSCLDSAHER